MRNRPAIHPGEHLAEQLEALGMSAAALARQLKVPTNRITHIINGQRAITGDTALRLGHFFGTSAEFWLNLQKIYELRVAEREIGADLKNLPRLRDRAAPRADAAGPARRRPAGSGLRSRFHRPYGRDPLPRGQGLARRQDHGA